jgi:hypothetical protein
MANGPSYQQKGTVMRCSALIVLVASLAAGASTLAAAPAKNECKTFGFSVND